MSQQRGRAARLVLLRRGQSEWNAKNLFTGWANPDLTVAVRYLTQVTPGASSGTFGPAGRGRAAAE